MPIIYSKPPHVASPRTLRQAQETAQIADSQGLCRAAWQLRDGEVSDVIESQYGWHLVKRLEFQQQIFILFTDDAIPSIREVMRRSRQEELLFQARAKAGVKLLL